MYKWKYIIIWKLKIFVHTIYICTYENLYYLFMQSQSKNILIHLRAPTCALCDTARWTHHARSMCLLAGDLCFWTAEESAHMFGRTVQMRIRGAYAYWHAQFERIYNRGAACGLHHIWWYAPKVYMVQTKETNLNGATTHTICACYDICLCSVGKQMQTCIIRVKSVNFWHCLNKYT